MRSREVAELAGVTVRTLRHYHQIGVLPEPPRQANGYRSYDLATIARLLRIRRLTELGVPLHQVEVMLETTPDREILDEIDRRLEAAIERLHEQRAQIASLRRTGARADLPEGFAELLSLGRTDGSVGVLDELDRDGLLLIARLIGPDHLSRQALGDLADALRPLRSHAELTAASVEFDRLAGDATQAQIVRLAERMAILLAPMAEHLADTQTGRALARAPEGHWPDLSRDRRLNGAQAQVMERLSALLASGVAG